MYHAMNINHFLDTSWNVGSRKAILFRTTTGEYGFRAFEDQIFVSDTILPNVEKNTSYATIEELSKQNASQKAFDWAMKEDIKMTRYEIVYRNEITAESRLEAIALALEDIQPDTLQVVEIIDSNEV